MSFAAHISYEISIVIREYELIRTANEPECCSGRILDVMTSPRVCNPLRLCHYLSAIRLNPPLPLPVASFLIVFVNVILSLFLSIFGRKG